VLNGDTPATHTTRAAHKLLPTYWQNELALRWRALGVWRDEPLGRCVTRLAVKAPQREVIIDEVRRITFAEFDAITRRLGAALSARGVSAGDVVTVQLPNWWEMVAICHAVMRIGAVANPVLPTLRAHELSFIVDQVRPQLVFVPEEFRGFRHVDMAGAIMDRTRVITVRGASSRGSGSFENMVEFDDLLAPELVEPSPDDPAMLLYTSGTTAEPKGVIHTHNTLRAEADGMTAGHECTPNDAILVTMPLAHIGGVLYAMLLPFTVGLKAILVDRWDPNLALQTIERERVTLHPGVPAFLHDMLQSSRFNARAVSSLRLFGLGGTRVTADDIHTAQDCLGCWAKRTYGSTEMPTLTTGPRSDEHDRVATSDGVIIGPSEIRIVDDEGTDVPTGAAGEIWCRGPELFVGYVDRELNDAAFAAGGWYRTGDIGWLDLDGFLTVTGRKKDVIIRGGENISPQEIEEILLTLDAIEDIAVVAMPDPHMGERACAFVVPTGASFDFEMMVNALKARGVASFKIPERLELRRDLPRTAVGKIRKDVLRDEIRGLLATESDQSRSAS
jgi:cyclohexanecarboxylate-CoA ligase